MKILSTFLVLSMMLFSCNSPAQKSKESKKETFEITKTDAEWKDKLSPEAYQVLRHEGTERAFSSDFCAFLSASSM